MKRRIRCDLAVIGAGSGGLSVAAGAAQLGLSVVLFEKGEMGGDCLNTGCVPSKALIAAARAAHALRASARFGIAAVEPQVDFPAVMAHVKGAIAAIAPHDSEARFEGLGVTVVREAAAFSGPSTLQSESAVVEARRIVIATGSRPKLPPIPGLDPARVLTNETAFDLQALPERLTVLGGGPIGLELAQAFARLGSRVTVLEANRALGSEDAEAVAVVLAGLREDGVDLREGARVAAVEGSTAVLESGERIAADHLLVATGREPAVDSLNLAAGGVEVDECGFVRTDKALRTTNRRVFAVGDAAGGAFTHEAGAHAALFVRKALFAAPVDRARLVIPRVVYTDPELAAVGLTVGQARNGHGEGVRVETVHFAKNDRAIADGDTRGFLQLVADRRSRILGVTIVGAHAGDLIQPWTLALAHGLKLRQIASHVPAYPTRGDASRAAASQVFQPVLFSDRTRRVVSLLKRLG